VCADNLGNRRGLAHMQGVCWAEDLRTELCISEIIQNENI
jgi:hypothetical protein